MKNKKQILKIFTTLAAVGVLTLGFNACSQQTPLESQSSLYSDSAAILYKGKPGKETNYSYPQTAKKVYTFWKARNKYRGGTLSLPNGTDFQLIAGALTPKPEFPLGKDITITVTAERDTVKNQLIFTFEPHGCQFSPAAKVYLNYADLCIDVPTLYYIDENGDYIVQKPDDIDVTNRNVILSIHHFSRYAIGME